ncbi:MAG: flagellar brake protein [Pseudomonadales bacterium]|nr:flagellar brake protein [Pseudomonadales bacterium]
MSENSKKNNASAEIPKDQILVDPVEIGKALATVVENRSQLTVRINDRLTPYVSLLVEVDSTKNVLYIDELLPKNGNDALCNGEIFSVRAMCRGIPLFFESNQILSVESEKGVLSYKIKFPKKLVYQQRRQFFRMAVGLTQNCDAVLAPSDDGLNAAGPSIRGRVVDLSARGVGVRILGQLETELCVGDKLSECEISLPDHDFINGPAEVRHFFYDEERDITICGLKFKGLNKVEQRTLGRYVLHLQREARKSPGG